MESLYDEALDNAGQVEQQEPEEVIDEETYALIYQGHLSKDIKVGTHEIRIRTLRIGEELEASLLAHKWADTNESGRALATALVAASIQTVDGQPLLMGLGPQDENLEAKFDYLRKNWYWITVGEVYKEYDGLLKIVLEKNEELSKD